MLPSKFVTANISTARDSPTAVQREATPLEPKPPVVNNAPPAANAACSSAEAPLAGKAGPINRSGHLYENPKVTGSARQYNGNAGFDQLAGGSHIYKTPTASGTSEQFNGNTTIEIHKSLVTRESK